MPWHGWVALLLSCPMKLSYEIWDSHGGDSSDWTVLSRNADINVWEEPAVSILVSTLKMEARVYSETSVTTQLHSVTTQKSTLLSLITAVFRTVSVVPLATWRLLADSRPVLWKHCSIWAGSETARSIQMFWGAMLCLGILNSSRCVGKLATLRVNIWVTWLREDQVGVCQLFKQCVLPPIDIRRWWRRRGRTTYQKMVQHFRQATSEEVEIAVCEE